MEHRDVHHITLNNRNIYLVGTAHVSKASVELVEAAITKLQPDVVAVELCQSRYDSLRDPDRWRKTDIMAVIKQGKVYLLMAQLILASFQKKIGKNLEVKPGAEMLKALELAEKHNSRVVLADREIRTTLKRTWHSIGLWSGIKLFSSLMMGIFKDDEISEYEIERLKSSDVLDSMMSELGASLPGIRISLIDERDRYLASKIAKSDGHNVVAVVGAGHVPGIKKYLEQDINISELEVEPPKSTLGKAITWGVPGLLLLLLVYGFYVGGASTSIEMISYWSLATAISAAVGALASFAHPFTVISAALSAPIATIHPLIATGWVAGLVEACIRKPKVIDLENIADDLTTLKGIWKNRLSHILIVIAFTNFGAMIGMAIGVPLVASLL